MKYKSVHCTVVSKAIDILVKQICNISNKFKIKFDLFYSIIQGHQKKSPFSNGSRMRKMKSFCERFCTYDCLYEAFLRSQTSVRKIDRNGRYHVKRQIENCCFNFGVFRSKINIVVSSEDVQFATMKYKHNQRRDMT